MSDVSKCCCVKEEGRIVMMGLDFSGKTTILYKLRLGEIVPTIPTIGFNLEDVECDNVKLTIWDIGGGDECRHLFYHYLSDVQGLIFVVDSTDRKRIVEARQFLLQILADEHLRKTPCLVIANKRDCLDKMSTFEIEEQLGLEFITNRKWRVQAASATCGCGLKEGLQWLAKRRRPGRPMNRSLYLT